MNLILVKNILSALTIATLLFFQAACSKRNVNGLVTKADGSTAANNSANGTYNGNATSNTNNPNSNANPNTNGTNTTGTSGNGTNTQIPGTASPTGNTNGANTSAGLSAAIAVLGAGVNNGPGDGGTSTGQAPSNAFVTPSVIGFGTVNAGTFNEVTVVLNNPGPSTLGTMSIQGLPATVTWISNCDTLGVNGSCSIRFRFAPLTATDNIAGSVQVNYLTSNSARSTNIPFTGFVGTASAAYVVSLYEPVINADLWNPNYFIGIEQNGFWIPFQNTTATTATGFVATSSDAINYTASTDCTTLALNQQCKLIFKINPKAPVGPQSFTVTLTYASGAGNRAVSTVINYTSKANPNPPVTPPVTPPAPVAGPAVLVSVAAIPVDLIQAHIGPVHERLITLRNTGARNAAGLTFSSNQTQFVSADAGCENVAPNANCNLKISFRPIDYIGDQNFDLNINYATGINAERAVTTIPFRFKGYHPLAISSQSRGGTRLFVRSLSTLAVLHNFDAFPGENINGISVASMDLNGDWQPDICVAPASGGTLRVICYDGKDRHILFNEILLNLNFSGGFNIALGRPVASDRVPYLLVGIGPGGASWLYTYRYGETTPRGAELMHPDTERSGIRIAMASLSGDGIDQVIVTGASNTNDSVGNPLIVHSVVRVVAASQNANGGVSYNPYSDFMTGSFSAGLGGTIAGGMTVAAGDLDGDGKAEIVVSAGEGGGPRVLVYKTQGLANQFFAPNTAAGQADRSGLSVSVGWGQIRTTRIAANDVVRHFWGALDGTERISYADSIGGAMSTISR